MKMLLERFCSCPEQGTFGRLSVDNEFICYTVERPWQNNEPWVSCIPAGVYTCSPYTSAKYPDVVELQDVPGRSKILIHAANTSKQLAGCIAPGSWLGAFGSEWAVMRSRDKLRELRAKWKDADEITITIRWEEHDFH